MNPNLEPTDSIYGHPAIKRIMLWIVTGMEILNNVVLASLGSIALLLLDVVLGGATYALIFQNGLSFSALIANIEWTKAFFAMGISLATSTIQMSYWERLLTDEADPVKLTQKSWLETIFHVLKKMNWLVLIVVGLDTLVDISSLCFFIYQESPMYILPLNPEPLYFVVAIILAILTSANEYWLAKIRKSLRDNSKPRP